VVDGKLRPLWHRGLVERRIETSEWDSSSHDVLAAPSARRVREAMGHISGWANAQFGK
jgi:hypothetical protein